MPSSHTIFRSGLAATLLLTATLAEAQVVQNRKPFNGNRVPAVQPANQPPPLAPQQAPRSYGQPAQAPIAPQATIDPRQAQRRKLPTRTHCLGDYSGHGVALDKASGTVKLDIVLTCNVPEQPTALRFELDGAQLATIQQADKSGFTLWVDYEDRQHAAEGNAPRTLTMLGAQEAYFSRVHVVCLPVGNLQSLTVGPRNGVYAPINTFCTDGQKVTPVSFAPDSKSFSFLNSAVEDGPLAVDYHLVMGGLNPKTGVISPYPIQRASKLAAFPPPGNWMSDAKHSSDAAIAGIATRCVPNGPAAGGAAGCFGNTPAVKVGNTTYAPKTSSTEYRTYFTAAIARAQHVKTVPPNHTKTVQYTLMPGVVPAEFRNATQGACRVALYSAVEIKPIPQSLGVSQGRAEHPKDAYCRKLFGNSEGIWGYSMIRQQEMCFASLAHLEADDQAAADKQLAAQLEYMRQSEAKYGKPQPAPIGVDSCELLPR